MFACLEEYFTANANSEVWPKCIKEQLFFEHKVQFPYELHELDLVKTITYYIQMQMQMRQYTKMIVISNLKTYINLKKSSKLAKT